MVAMTRTKLLALATLGLLLVTTAVSASASGSRGDPRNAVRIDATGAQAGLEWFLGRPLNHANVDQPERGRWKTLFHIGEDTVEAYVDAVDGRPVLVSWLGRVPSQGRPLAAAAARDRAGAFLAEHGLQPATATPSVQLVDHGSVKTFEVRWQALSGGALPPNWQLVELDAVSGAVITLATEDRPYAPAPAPTVALEDARARAFEAAGFNAGSLTRSELRIVFDPADGTQLLVWSLTLEQPTDGIPDRALVEVNAMSGDAVVVGRG